MCCAHARDACHLPCVVGHAPHFPRDHLFAACACRRSRRGTAAFLCCGREICAAFCGPGMATVSGTGASVFGCDHVSVSETAMAAGAGGAVPRACPRVQKAHRLGDARPDTAQ